MDKKRLDPQRVKRLDNLMLDYGEWIRGGRASEGMYSCPWPEITRKEPYKPIRSRRIAGKPKPLVTPHQPHSTPKEQSSKALRGELHPVFTRIHTVVMIQPEVVRLVICCIWIKGMCYQDTGKALNMTSKQIGNSRIKVLKLIESARVFC